MHIHKKQLHQENKNKKPIHSTDNTSGGVGGKANKARKSLPLITRKRKKKQKPKLYNQTTNKTGQRRAPKTGNCLIIFLNKMHFKFKSEVFYRICFFNCFWQRIPKNGAHCSNTLIGKRFLVICQLKIVGVSCWVVVDISSFSEIVIESYR